MSTRPVRAQVRPSENTGGHPGTRSNASIAGAGGWSRHITCTPHPAPRNPSFDLRQEIGVVAVGYLRAAGSYLHSALLRPHSLNIVVDPSSAIVVGTRS